MIHFVIFAFLGCNANGNQRDGTPLVRCATSNEVCNNNGACAGT